MRRKLLIGGLAVFIGALAGAQLFQPRKTNPPADPASSFEALAKPPAEAASVVRRACHDCHSNQTVWPWYSAVAPVSWLIAHDVNAGRAHLNFSEWDRFGPEASMARIRDACQQMREKEMPPWYYVRLHPSASVNESDIRTVCGSGD